MNHKYKLVIINKIDKMCLVYTKVKKTTIIKPSGRKPLYKLLYNSLVRYKKDLEYLKRILYIKFRYRLYYILFCQSRLY